MSKLISAVFLMIAALAGPYLAFRGKVQAAARVSTAPEFSVESHYTLEGQVRVPGRYLLRPGMTLMGGITKGGGWGGIRDPRFIKLVRGHTTTRIDIRRLNPDGSNNPVLQDGDVIQVPK